MEKEKAEVGSGKEMEKEERRKTELCEDEKIIHYSQGFEFLLSLLLLLCNFLCSSCYCVIRKLQDCPLPTYYSRVFWYERLGLGITLCFNQFGIRPFTSLHVLPSLVFIIMTCLIPLRHLLQEIYKERILDSSNKITSEAPTNPQESEKEVLEADGDSGVSSNALVDEITVASQEDEDNEEDEDEDEDEEEDILVSELMVEINGLVTEINAANARRNKCEEEKKDLVLELSNAKALLENHKDTVDSFNEDRCKWEEERAQLRARMEDLKRFSADLIKGFQVESDKWKAEKEELVDNLGGAKQSSKYYKRAMIESENLRTKLIDQYADIVSRLERADADADYYHRLLHMYCYDNDCDNQLNQTVATAQQQQQQQPPSSSCAYYYNNTHDYS